MVNFLCMTVLVSGWGDAGVTARANALSEQVIAVQTSIQRLMYDAYVTSENHDPERSQRSRIVNAMAANVSFADIMHGTTPETPPWQDAARKKRWIRGNQMTLLNEFERSAATRTVTALQDRRPGALYEECIGWRCPNEPRTDYMQGGKPFRLIDVFASDLRNRLLVRPDAEEIRGLPCVVVEVDAGRDQLWICPERGHGLVKRVIKTAADPGIRMEYNCFDHQEVIPGVWLPRTTTGEYRKGPELKLQRTYRLDLVYLVINGDVPDAVFEPRYPPGTHVYDDKYRRLRAIVPGGSDLPDLWAAVVGSRFPPSQPAPMPMIDQALIVGTAGTCLFTLGLICLVQQPLRGLARRGHASPDRFVTMVSATAHSPSTATTL